MALARAQPEHEMTSSGLRPAFNNQSTLLDADLVYVSLKLGYRIHIILYFLSIWRWIFIFKTYILNKRKHIIKNPEIVFNNM